MAEILNTETITELDTVDLSIGSWMVHADSSGNAAKMSTPMMLNYLNGIYGTKQELFVVNQTLNSISAGSLNVFPTDSPTSKVNTYNAMTAGTYTNFGGLVVTSAEITNGTVQLLRSGSTWTKKVIPIGTLPNTIPTPSNETFDII